MNKMRILVFPFIVSLMIILAGIANAQPNVKFQLYGPYMINDYTVRFKIYVKNTGTDTTDYLYCQAYINFDSLALNGGAASCSVINDSSDLPPSHTALFSAGVSTTGPSFRFTYLGAPQLTNKVSILPGDSIRIVLLQLTTSAVTFVSQNLNAVWRAYDGPNPKTKYFYVIGGVAAELTSSSNYDYFSVDVFVPVELVSLEVSAEDRNVNLTWQTKTELNLGSFEIQRKSTNNAIGEWISIGNIAAAGNSTTPRDYNFMDKKLNSGKYSYRIKMIDYDGSFEYSEIVQTEIALPKEYNMSQNYPNPFNPVTRIDYQLPFDSRVTIELFGITGEKISTIYNGELPAGYFTADVNAVDLNLASGVYICRFSASGQHSNSVNFLRIKKLLLTK